MNETQYFEQFVGDVEKETWVISYPAQSFSLSETAYYADAIFDNYDDALAHLEKREHQQLGIQFELHTFPCLKSELLVEELSFEIYWEMIGNA